MGGWGMAPKNGEESAGIKVIHPAELIFCTVELLYEVGVVNIPRKLKGSAHSQGWHRPYHITRTRTPCSRPLRKRVASPCVLMPSPRTSWKETPSNIRD